MYIKGSFKIDKINNINGTLGQLEGRFAFINQIDIFNRELKGENKYKDYKLQNLSSTEKQYQKFLFFRYFYGNPKPLIVTEGKTDIIYIKADLKNLYTQYPELIKKQNDGTFEFRVSFPRKSERLSYLLRIPLDGDTGLQNIYNYYSDKNGQFRNFSKTFRDDLKVKSRNPVFLLFDNESVASKKPRPLRKFINYADLKQGRIDTLLNTRMLNISNNLYVLTVPLINGNTECEIEDLLDQSTLNYMKDGKTFRRDEKEFNDAKHYGKKIFSEYINENYLIINFSNSKEVLDNIESAIIR
ncbi:hypothetical protein [Shouchella patagoniensis]|uniref:hypothetical protein n=1 Tax=Shouchella patagoniensis TaxID=228576 RepID=UPI0011161F3A|nr:hypothetical protein [Shouchella patagoniensis]